MMSSQKIILNHQLYNALVSLIIKNHVSSEIFLVEFLEVKMLSCHQQQAHIFRMPLFPRSFQKMSQKQ